MSTLLIYLAVFIYLLIGWFVMNLAKEDWEDPSLLLTILWPLLLIAYGVIRLFEIVGDIAVKIKEKKDD